MEVYVELDSYPNVVYTSPTTFDVVIILDPCWTSTLTASVMAASYTWDLGVAETMTATAMINFELRTACSGFTYELEFISGVLTGFGIDPLTTYTLLENGVGGSVTMSGTPNSYEWIGSNTFRIKCTNGHISNSPRGDGAGLYNSVYSNDFVITIDYPCPSSIINFDNSIAVADIVALNSEK